MWYNHDLESYLEENMHGGIDITFNFHQNAKIVIKENGVNPDNTNKKE